MAIMCPGGSLVQHSILRQSAAPDQPLQAAEACRIRLKGMQNGLSVAVLLGGKLLLQSRTVTCSNVNEDVPARAGQAASVCLYLRSLASFQA